MKYLYICTQGAKIGYTGHRIYVGCEGEMVKEIPVEPLECLELYGNVQITTQAMQELMVRDVQVGFYSALGFYLGRLGNPKREGKPELVSAQVRQSHNNAFRMKMAKNIIRAKMHNQKVVLRRHSDHYDDYMREAVRNMDILEKTISRAESINEIMGIEGNCARIYFEALGKLVGEPFQFRSRSKRPARDPFNALINFGYAVQLTMLEGKITLRGMHPAIGLIHSTHANKKALSYDIMEEWRPVIVDTLALHCLRGGELREEHFEIDAEGAIRLTRDGMRIFRKKTEDRYEATSSYLKGGTDMTFRRALKYQVDRLANAMLENDPGIYEPCRIR